LKEHRLHTGVVDAFQYWGERHIEDFSVLLFQPVLHGQEAL
jgi:hypothetical protein